MDIKGLNKAAILACLYNASKPQGMGFFHYKPEAMTVEQAGALLQEQTYFDYLQGRVMKIDLKGDDLETWLYNRDNGPEAAEHAIARMLAGETK